MKKAKKSAILTIGNIQIPCAVLEDDTRVLSATAVQESFGGHRLASVGEAGATKLPRFLASQTMKSFVSADLAVQLKCLEFTPERGGKPVLGYDCEVLPLICEAIQQADQAGVLRANQQRMRTAAFALSAALARVGIMALIDEATGHRAEQGEYKALFEQSLQREAGYQRMIAEGAERERLAEERVVGEQAQRIILQAKAERQERLLQVYEQRNMERPALIGARRARNLSCRVTLLVDLVTASTTKEDRATRIYRELRSKYMQEAWEATHKDGKVTRWASMTHEQAALMEQWIDAKERRLKRSLRRGGRHDVVRQHAENLARMAGAAQEAVKTAAQMARQGILFH